MNIYQQLTEAGCQISNHYSDLYVEVSEASRKIIRDYEFLSKVQVFRNNLDGRLWYDIPFAYEPYWEEKQAKIYASES